MNSPEVFRPGFFPARAGKSAPVFWGRSKQSRGYGADWESLSIYHRARHPVCQICEAAVSVAVHHVQPFRSIDDPLRLDVGNLQAVCSRCHAVAHQKINRGL